MAKNSLSMMLSSFFGAVLLLPSVLAQVPFDITGTITSSRYVLYQYYIGFMLNFFSLSLDAGTNPVRGGSITVDGIKITVPTNLLATLPAITVAWPELFTNNVADLPGNGPTWEAHVCFHFSLSEIS
jgi:hypothetical protein